MEFLQEREDARRNILQASGRKVRERASLAYSLEAGSAGGKEMVADKSYRDNGVMRMADVRFQKCLMTWYFSVRRTPTKHITEDLSKLEFSVAELAYVDMEVCDYDRYFVCYVILCNLICLSGDNILFRACDTMIVRYAFQVKRTLLGEVRKDSGYLGVKSKDLQVLYEESLSVVQSWKISEFANCINVVEKSFLLGKEEKKIFLDVDTMAAARLK